jgi:hypothetical protein
MSTRRILPQRRSAETFQLRFWNQQFTVTVGQYPDGTVIADLVASLAGLGPNQRAA